MQDFFGQKENEGCQLVSDFAVHRLRVHDDEGPRQKHTTAQMETYLWLVALLGQEHEPRNAGINFTGRSSSVFIHPPSLTTPLRLSHQWHSRIKDGHIGLALALLGIRLLEHHLVELAVKLFVLLSGLGFSAGKALKD